MSVASYRLFILLSFSICKYTFSILISIPIMKGMFQTRCVSWSHYNKNMYKENKES